MPYKNLGPYQTAALNIRSRISISLVQRRLKSKSKKKISFQLMLKVNNHPAVFSAVYLAQWKQL